MKTLIVFAAFLLSSSLSNAAPIAPKQLSCVGKIDPGARYTLQAELNEKSQIQGDVHIGYEDNDGFRFSSDVTPKTSTLTPGKAILIEGEFNGGTMKFEATYQAEKQAYIGELKASGSMGEGIDSEMLCTF
jgi:hypothetical protein